MKKKATLITVILLLVVLATMFTACEVKGNPDSLGIASMNVGERLLTGLLVFIMGLGMVFIVLFVLIAIIKLVAYIQTLPERLAKKKAQESVVEEQPSLPAPVQQIEVAADEDEEIVVAITAAIAAYYGAQPVEMSDLKFRVRSIREIK